jgi:hypothetical protein
MKVEKASYDDRVERSLAQRALGYSYHAEKPFRYQGEVVKVQYVEHVPPHVAAAKFWLLNRRRAQWSDTSRHELTGANGGEIKINQDVVEFCKGAIAHYNDDMIDVLEGDPGPGQPRARRLHPGAQRR